MMLSAVAVVLLSFVIIALAALGMAAGLLGRGHPLQPGCTDKINPADSELVCKQCTRSRAQRGHGTATPRCGRSTSC